MAAQCQSREQSRRKGLLLLGAYKFDIPIPFTDLSAKSITDLEPDLSSWDASAELQILPTCLKDICLLAHVQSLLGTLTFSRRNIQRNHKQTHYLAEQHGDYGGLAAKE